MRRSALHCRHRNCTLLTIYDFAFGMRIITRHNHMLCGCISGAITSWARAHRTKSYNRIVTRITWDSLVSNQFNKWFAEAHTTHSFYIGVYHNTRANCTSTVLFAIFFNCSTIVPQRMNECVRAPCYCCFTVHICATTCCLNLTWRYHSKCTLRIQNKK